MKQLILHLCLMSVPIFAIAQAQDFRPLKPQEEIRQIQQTLLEIPPMPPLPPIPAMPPMPHALTSILDNCQTLNSPSEIPITPEFEYHFGFNHSFDFDEDDFRSIFKRQGWDELQQLELPEKNNKKFLEMLPFYQFFKS